MTTNPSSVQNIHYGDVLVKYGAVVNISEDTPPYIKPTIDLQKFVATSYLRDGDIVFADTAEDYSVGKATEIAGANGLAVLSGLHTSLSSTHEVPSDVPCLLLQFISIQETNISSRSGNQGVFD